MSLSDLVIFLVHFQISQSYDFLRTLGQVRDQVPVAYVLVYGLGNIVLQGLNWFWFVKCLGSLRSSSRSGLQVLQDDRCTEETVLCQ